MAERATGVNPQVLSWARVRAGLSVEDVAETLGRTPESIEAWETGADVPTFRQLEALAERIYKRPIALFFFPDPPAERNPESEFRTLPDSELELLASDTRYAIRQGYAWQQSLRELTGGKNPSDRLITRAITATVDDEVDEVVARVREWLGVSLETQREWSDQTTAFKNWREAVEQSGVFVFKRSFEQRAVSGFCLDDTEFPIIVINNSTAHARQTFTLFHELAHLLFDVSGITKDDDSFIERLGDTDRRIEVACNRFAAEFLVPSSTFPWTVFNDPEDIESNVVAVANSYNVSREVVLRRLLDRNLVSRRQYEHYVARWTEEFEQYLARSSGGNYYATQATYLGNNFLKLAFGLYRVGRISRPDLVEHLGVKAKNLGRLEEFLLTRR